PARLPRDRPRQEEHLVDRDRDGRGLVAEHDHRRGVADEDDVDPRILGEARAGGVVGGDHDDLVAAALHRGELRERQLAGGKGGSHYSAPFRTTLSIRRMPPTRTAAARTGGGDGGGSTRAASTPFSRRRASTGLPVASARDRMVACRRCSGESIAFREERASPSASRTMGTTRTSSSRSRSRTMRRTTSTCCASFCPKYTASG